MKFNIIVFDVNGVELFRRKTRYIPECGKLYGNAIGTKFYKIIERFIKDDDVTIELIVE